MDRLSMRETKIEGELTKFATNFFLGFSADKSVAFFGINLKNRLADLQEVEKVM